MILLAINCSTVYSHFLFPCLSYWNNFTRNMVRWLIRGFPVAAEYIALTGSHFTVFQRCKMERKVCTAVKVHDINSKMQGRKLLQEMANIFPEFCSNRFAKSAYVSIQEKNTKEH